MNQQSTHRIQSMLADAVDARIPENIQAIAERSVVRTRETYDKVKGLAADSATIAHDVLHAAQSGAKTIAEKALRHTEVNTETAFDTALPSPERERCQRLHICKRTFCSTKSSQPPPRRRSCSNYQLRSRSRPSRPSTRLQSKPSSN